MHTSNISTGAKIRNLGALERLFWLLDQNRPAHFAMAAQIEGHVPTEQLREATRALVTRSPLILSAISRSATGCWFPRGTEPVFPPRSEPPLSMVF